MGSRAFTVSSRTAARHTFFPSSYSGPGREVDVECTTLPELLDELRISRVDLLKIDTEGAEYDILLTCDPATLARVQAIAVEIHETDGIPHTRDELVRHLTSAGFVADIYEDRSKARGRLRIAMGLFTRPPAPAASA